jgi:hypothetical protein
MLSLLLFIFVPLCGQSSPGEDFPGRGGEVKEVQL